MSLVEEYSAPCATDIVEPEEKLTKENCSNGVKSGPQEDSDSQNVSLVDAADIKHENQKGPSTSEVSEEVNEENDDTSLLDENGWMDLLGSGELKKRVIAEGKGPETQAKKGDLVTLSYTCYDGENIVLEQVTHFEICVGDLDVNQGFDLIIPFTQEGESLEALVPSRLAYGKIGRPPNILPNCNLRYEIEILSVKTFDESSLNMEDVLRLGNKKREMGNFWYGRSEHLNAIHCYQRAAEILDGGHDGSDSSDVVLQDVLDTKIKVHNNIAAAQLKLEAYDQALRSVDYVLRIQPKNVKAHFRKAKILMAKGHTDGALASMRKASDLEPETKVIQQEIQRLMQKKKMEEKSQRDMYKRMFPPSASKSKSSKKWVIPWSIMAGSCLVLALGVAYRQYFT